MEQLTMTVEEMAKVLGISRPVAYNLANITGFPAIRVGRRILISKAGLERWVSEQEGRGVAYGQ